MVWFGRENPNPHPKGWGPDVQLSRSADLPWGAPSPGVPWYAWEPPRLVVEDESGLELAKKLGGLCLHPRSSLISAGSIPKILAWLRLDVLAMGSSFTVKWSLRKRL